LFIIMYHIYIYLQILLYNKYKLKNRRAKNYMLVLILIGNLCPNKII